MFFLDHLCHAVNEIELADCFKVSVHHMDHNLVLGLALGLGPCPGSGPSTLELYDLFLPIAIKK